MSDQFWWVPPSGCSENRLSTRRAAINCPEMMLMMMESAPQFQARGSTSDMTASVSGISHSIATTKAVSNRRFGRLQFVGAMLWSILQAALGYKFRFIKH
ncbi:hypothetical protein ZHAS_00013200 [Anopheles sinensis]|uniref:Uncharacterized protein n=1 Tax=Anopheles sinensis TaxID=74873 RepID=A0A084W4W1_ANOSI|nr:hypothetical protein ZHAS_00013200 [Anopheles sinensis]